MTKLLPVRSGGTSGRRSNQSLFRLSTIILDPGGKKLMNILNYLFVSCYSEMPRQGSCPTHFLFYEPARSMNGQEVRNTDLS